MKHLLGCCLVLATTTTALAVLPGKANRVRALAERVTADLAYTADEICAALERLAEESKDRGHYTRGGDN